MARRPILINRRSGALRSPARILEEFARHRGYEVGIITKSNMMVRDIELLQASGEDKSFFGAHYDDDAECELARILEPRAPRPDLRMDAVRELSAAGLRVGVSCSPVMPGITDAPKDLESVIKAAAEAGAQYVFANPLFLKPCSAAVFLPFLEQNFPHLAANYRQRYQDRAFLPAAYGQRLAELVKRLREKYGITQERRERFATKWAEPVEEQLKLF